MNTDTCPSCQSRIGTYFMAAVTDERDVEIERLRVENKKLRAENEKLLAEHVKR